MNFSANKTIIIAIAVCVVVIGIGAAVLYGGNKGSGTGTQLGAGVTPTTPLDSKTLTEARAQYLETDPVDITHINNIKSLQTALEKYYANKLVYPTKLSQLAPSFMYLVPKYSSNEDYLYAYYPADKPTKYHLGAKLGGKNPADTRIFSQDADFNSNQAGYVNGFDGADPVYDLTGGN